MPASIVFTGIAPHPPILVPEIGGSRIQRIADSQRALRELSRRVVRAEPETVVVISPHSPLDPRAFAARSTPRLTGDFSNFYAPSVKLSFDNDLALIDSIAAAATRERIEVLKLERNYPLDHGALVPLYYLHEAGWTGPIVVFSFTDQSIGQHVAFGRLIEKGASEINRRTAVVASADLSHRLIEDGPYEFEPTAHLFDECIVNSIAAGDARAVIEVDQELRFRAGECGYRSILIALGVIENAKPQHQVLSYEGPFGVGYMVAVLSEQPVA
jgi:MEMO1 family protein